MSNKTKETEMTEKTRELLLAMKAAGYEHATVFVDDNRVPDSVRIRKGSIGFYWGHGSPWNAKAGTGSPFKVICGAPAVRVDCGPDADYGHPTQPAVRAVLKQMELAGRHTGVSGDGHDIDPIHCDKLTAGYYSLSEVV